MQVYKNTGLLLLASFVVLTSAAYGADVDRDKDKDKPNRSTSTASKVRAGECPSEGSAAAELDVNNVRARLHNNGNLFFAADHLYEVPKGSGRNSVFASGIWLGGYAGNELRMAAATYSNYEFRPGPLFDDGTAPADCGPYDRFWKVNKTDVETYEATGEATNALSSWPTGLGAPTLDAEGNLVVPTSMDQTIDLVAGERPQILGDQTIWWIMNDVAAPHNTTETPPIGIEAQVTAFAFNQAGALGNTTFYKYRLAYKGDVPLRDVFLGIWSDPDLGGAGDDYVGSDTTLGLGFVYNGRPTDSDYGDRPPALGYDFFQGPLVEAPGETWTDPDGTVHENATRLGMQKFIYYNNDATSQGNPTNAEEYYNYLTGFWRDNVPITFGGTGRGFSNTPADYMYPADPPAFWSEFNIDNAGTAVSPSDRRFIQSVGPFAMNPGDVQEIVFGIVWAQDTEAASDPHLASLQKLKRDDALAQRVFDINFALPDPPDAPRVNVTELNQSVILTWDYPPASNNYLGRYEAINPLISDVPDTTFNFEGFIIYRFTSAADTEGEVVAVFDQQNEITRIMEETPEGLVRVDVEGTDSGLQYSMQFTGLTNYTEYHYGVQAYAYNEFSSPRTYKSAIRRVTAVPARVGPRAGGTLVDETNIGAAPDTVIADQAGQGVVSARIVDPAQVTGATYRVEFYAVEKSDDEGHTQTFTVYDVTNVDTGTKIFDGTAYLDRSCTRSGTFNLADCTAPPQQENVFVAQGVSFSITGPAPGPLVVGGAEMFVEVAGPTDAYACGPEAGSRFGCDEVGGNLVYASYNGAFSYLMYHGGAEGPETVIGAYAPHDFEIRFTAEGSFAVHPFSTDDDVDKVVWVPFEVWDIGTVGAFGENDPSDDVQMIVNLFAPAENGCGFGYDVAEGEDPFGLGWPATDWVYAYYPTTTYEEWESAVQPLLGVDLLSCPALAADSPAWGLIDFGRGRPIQRIQFYGDPELGEAHPAEGVVIRFLTTKPNLPGDVFTFSTDEFTPTRGDRAIAEAALDDIGIVPNPYKGASAYEVSRITDEVRITNLPERATIRIFTLSGTLIRTLEKNSPEPFIRWNLQTDNGLPIASGMYLVHVETEFGDRVVKFGVVKKTVHLNEL